MNDILPTPINEKRIKEGRVTVLGIGVSNRPLIDFLLRKGAKITARDKKSYEALMPHSKELTEKGVELILGDAYLENITENEDFFDINVKMPKKIPEFLCKFFV